MPNETEASDKDNSKGNNYYYGMPLRRIFKRKIMEYLKISEEDLNRAEELRIRQESEKANRILDIVSIEN